MHILSLLFYMLACFLVAYVGKERKMGFWLTLLFSMIFTPWIVAVVLLVTDVRRFAPEKKKPKPKDD